MALNDTYMQEMKRQIDGAKNAEAAAVEVAVPEVEPSLRINEVTAPAAQTPDTTAELEALRAEFEAYKAAKVEVPSSEPTQQADTEQVDFYDSPDDRQLLVDQLGEDVVRAQELMLARAFKAKDKLTEKKLSELESRNSKLEQANTSAAFTRAVGSEALAIFNDAAFQAVAKGTETGFKRNLFDDLQKIVEGSDLEGAEYLQSQINKYKTGQTAVKKAQVSAGRSPSTSAQQAEAFDQAKASKLLVEVQRHRVGTEAFNKAKTKMENYLALATN
jgi:hypothetical protein